ncbi:MAG: amidohydrolase [Deltaproteobacteria bacterium]|uniref:Amidohydrolase n=1 Tax=Candidatus Zymogenus saltonus TaxID=2844893 RepID=A0A9D8KA35_9DELT|nr:amidohydrolase [Candidatus Zymogenus saltonus]
MEKIIDIHTHLGDIIYPNGGELIEKTGVKKKIFIDLISVSEMMLHPDFGGAIYESPLYPLITRASRARNLTATRENMRRDMDKYGVVKSACMPIPPYLTFGDLKVAAKKDKGIIPFTGVDFTQKFDKAKVRAKLKEDVEEGAKGLKLHPILQKVSLTDKKTFETVEAFAPHEFPILFHLGISHYYPKDEEDGQVPEYGEAHYARDLVKAFPKVKFIVGHAGLYEIDRVIEMMSSLKNAYVDVSIQSPKNIRKLIDSFGPERVLFASDWPWGSRSTPIRAVKRACRGDKKISDMIFYKNAEKLLKISI